MEYPRMVRIRQHLERPRVEDVAQAVLAEMQRLDLGRTIRPGQTVALTAGSRGIANIPLLLRATATFLKDLGARPFLVPAMGSHGGGTAEGQRRILESYGITEQAVGAPVRASMDVVRVGTTPEKEAKLAADIPIGRVASTEEIAAVVTFLSSQDAGYLTGTTVDINGGSHIH